MSIRARCELPWKEMISFSWDVVQELFWIWLRCSPKAKKSSRRVNSSMDTARLTESGWGEGMAVSAARAAAFAILLRVERESAYAVELLHSGLLDGLSAIDRNLTTDLVMGVLRWRSKLDASIASLVPVTLRKLDLEVLIAR